MITDKWVCDTCGQTIKEAHDGWVEWIIARDEEGNSRGRDMRIVHHYPASPLKDKGIPGCQFDQDFEYSKDGGIVLDLPLEDLLRPDGLMKLLAMISIGEVPAGEVIEVIKRLHIPGYEQARPYFDQAIYEGIIEPDMPDGFYWQEQIKAVIHNIGRLEKER